MDRAIVRPAARRDLIRHFAYIGENSSLGAARRFLAEARDSFLELAQMPHLGAPRKTKKFPKL
jgi:plasmid stabilization system protein ParE